MNARLKQSQKDAALIGLEITWVYDFACNYTDEVRGIIDSFTPLLQTGKIIRATPAFVWVEYVLSGKTVRERFDKDVLLRKVPGCDARNYIPEQFTQVRRLLEESLPDRKEPKPPIEYVAYTLSDNQGTIHYVGISKNVDRRYSQHCKCSGLNLKLNLWIQGLLEQGQLPQITIVDTATDQEEAEKLETQLIAHYLKLGAPLKNIAKRIEVEQ